MRPYRWLQCSTISQLDYCNALYMWLPLKMIWKLQQVQNANSADSSGHSLLRPCVIVAVLAALVAIQFLGAGLHLQSPSEHKVWSSQEMPTVSSVVPAHLVHFRQSGSTPAPFN